MASSQQSLAEARDFLDQLGLEGSKTQFSNPSSVAEANHSPSSHDDHRNKNALLICMRLLSQIHDSVLAEGPQTADDVARVGTPARKTICQLLETLVLCGVQPYLSPGVGVPLHQRTRLQISPLVLERIRADKADETQMSLPLVSIMDVLLAIDEVHGEGVEPVMRDHILPDLVYGLAELSYSPQFSVNQQVSHTVWTSRLVKLLDQLPTSTTLRIVTSLATPSAPSWLRMPLLDYISAVPLRPNGVRSVIDFVALSASSQSTSSGFESTPRQGPSLTSDTLSEISNLLAAVPRNMTEQAYYTNISKQLFALLDGIAGLDLAKIAANVIGSGVLGRRSVGAPGSIGWKMFAEPILRAINPSTPAAKPQLGFQNPGKGTAAHPDKPLISQEDLSLALSRLSLIVNSTPNAGLTKRLISGLFLPLWALHTHAVQHSPQSTCATISWDLLKLYMKRCATAKQLCDLASHIFWDGDHTWQFSSSSSGGVEIRPRRSRKPVEAGNVIELMTSLQGRVSRFIDLLSTGVDATMLGSVFFDVSKRWLLPQKNSNLLLDTEDTINPLSSLANASVVQEMLVRFKGEVTKSRANVFELIQQVLKEHNAALEVRMQKREGLNNPGLVNLEDIVGSRSTQHRSAQQNSHEKAQVESESANEMVSMGLSLFSATLATTDTTLGQEDLKALSTVASELKSLLLHRDDIDDETAASATTLLSLISASSAGTAHVQPKVPAKPPQETNDLERDRKVHQDALTNITNDHPAIRAEGLFMLRSLIQVSVPADAARAGLPTQHRKETTAMSPIIDTTTTVYLLLSILQDPEEYVYLSVISTLVALAFHHPRKVLLLLTQTYADKPEGRSMDERLRIGEALARIFSEVDDPQAGSRPLRLGHKLRHDIAERLMETVSRRGVRHREAARRREDKVQLDREAARMWGGEVPDVSQLITDMDEPHVEANSAERQARIARGWEGADTEEDVRIRASAVTLLGKALRREAAESDVTTCVDMASDILALEPGDEKAILRRAAALLVLELVRSDVSRSQLGAQKVREVAERFRRVKHQESDELVRGHVEVLLEEIAALQAVRFIDDRQAYMQRGGVHLPEGRLAGLSIEPAGASNGAARVVLIEEVED